MSDVLLSECDQIALRFLLAAEPPAGQPLPPSDVLERLASLVHCDAIGAAVTDLDGYVVDQVELPHARHATPDDLACGEPLRIGVVHVAKVPGGAARIRAAGLSDSLTVGLRDGRGRVVQVWWNRWTGEFTERDVALLTMIEPAVRRLVREAATPALPPSLTVQERRTLTLVAAGSSNVQIAQHLGVATCTVRKHLEHVYRKLGVTNRLAAAVALRGDMVPPSERGDESLVPD